MAAVTVTGTVGGSSITVPTNTALQAALAQSIISAATAPGALISASGASTTTTAYTVDVSTAGSVLTGNPTITAAQVLLAGQLGTFITGSQNPPVAATTIVVAADNSNSSIVNVNPLGGLIVQTGAGGNVLYGATGANNFFTGTGGQDIVLVNGAANSVTSAGSDAVLVGGPTTVTATAGGLDNILVTTGTNLAFINGSRSGGVDSITGAANSAIVIAGPGATSITSGVGPEAFYIDTGAGNVTLNGSLQTNDAITFLKDSATTPGTASIVVNNFAGSAVNVHGYSGVQYGIGTSGAGSTLTLTDGSSVTFTNLTAAQLTAITKTI